MVSSHLSEGRQSNPNEQIENLTKQLGLVTHAYKLSTWKAGGKGCQEFEAGLSSTETLCLKSREAYCN